MGVSLYPYSIGMNGNTLWYSVPNSASHNFYNNGVNRLTINSSGQTTISNELIVVNQIKENNQYLNNVYVSSNVLQFQNYINSNSVANISSFYISSNVFQSQNYINGNSVANSDVLAP